MIQDKDVLLANESNISPSELLTILERQQAMKKELVVTPSYLNFDRNNDLHIMNFPHQVVPGVTGRTSFHLEPTVDLIRSFCQRYKIHASYRDAMLNRNPHMLAMNLNEWLFKDEADGNKPFMIRTFSDETGKGVARCLVSDQFGFIDNLDAVTAVMDVVNNANREIINPDHKLEVIKCSISPSKMYLYVATHAARVKIDGISRNYRNPEDPAKRSDDAVVGFVLSNSEIGKGSFNVSPFIGLSVCSNGMVWKRFAYNKTHKGTKLQQGMIQWSTETKTNHNALELSKVKDVVKEFCSERFINQRVSEIQNSMNTPIEDPVRVIENMEVFGFSEQRRKDLLNLFAGSGGHKSVFAISQAVNFLAHTETPDNAQDLMEFAGAMIEDPRIVTRIDKEMKVTASKVRSVFSN